nr:MAG TPA: hypothetical protein [Caudoviricetes sp.]
MRLKQINIINGVRITYEFSTTDVEKLYQPTLEKQSVLLNTLSSFTQTIKENSIPPEYEKIDQWTSYTHSDQDTHYILDIHDKEIEQIQSLNQENHNHFTQLGEGIITLVDGLKEKSIYMPISSYQSDYAFPIGGCTTGVGPTGV